MRKVPKFDLVYDDNTISHVRAIDRKHHRMITRTLVQQLCHEPDVQTRNRKPLTGPVPWGATWELRFGPGNSFRAFYDINESGHIVDILAVGVKEGNRLWVGGEEIAI